MIGMVNAYGDTPRETETYTYYPNGNKKSVTDITGRVTRYTYDNAGRLTAETVDGVATAYTYDGYNNRIGKTENGVQTSYIYDSRNRLTKESFTKNGQTAVTSYQYDPNGNLYSRQTLTFKEDNTTRAKASAVLMGYTAETNDILLEYNNLNQLTAVTKGNEVISYDYYANGMRKSKTVDEVTTTHIWDGQNMAGEFIDGQFAGYLRGNRLIARQTDEDTQYYHFNGHGDTLSLTDGNGTTLQNYTYDAFGNVKNFHELDTNPFRYCGEYFDQETGFIYLRARYYAPEIGRFISEDPVQDGLNWYVYCGNNPVMFVDPWGLWEDGDEKYPEFIQTAIKVYTQDWEYANQMNDYNGMRRAHEKAESARILGNSIVTRDEWGAKEFDNKWGDDPKKDTIVIHHTNNNDSMKMIESAHVKKGYGDVGYHFVIAADGLVYEGTVLNSKGAHVDSANTGKIGVALIGDYEPDFWDWWDETPPTDEQLMSMYRLVGVLQTVYGIENVNKHSDFNQTKCPGTVVVKILERVY